jgi:hypothetical protein
MRECQLSNSLIASRMPFSLFSRHTRRVCSHARSHSRYMHDISVYDSGLECDISVGSQVNTAKSRLIRQYVDADPRVRILITGNLAHCRTTAHYRLRYCCV